MTNTENAEEESLLLSRDGAKSKAEDLRGKPDPLPDIKPSLLSAEHIKKYVLETGLISPFYEGGGRSSRLKKASYEGRIGTCAFKYNECGELVNLPIGEDLIVPANSIVFVECDLDFRLPENIALRFNLQIRHVHRGLLLGTGPLVDPGYWGKLCIPLHNLTDESYKIPVREGLIWVEFTKTTSDLNGDKPIGRVPLGNEFWNIRDFIIKASTPFDGTLNTVPIRSSIPALYEDAVGQAKKASSDATKAKRAALWIQGISIVAGIAVVIGVVALWLTFYTGMDGNFSTTRSRIDQILLDVAGVKKDIDGIRQSVKTQSELSKTSGDLQQAVSRITVLEGENASLRSRISDLERVVESSPSKGESSN